MNSVTGERPIGAPHRLEGPDMASHTAELSICSASPGYLPGLQSLCSLQVGPSSWTPQGSQAELCLGKNFQHPGDRYSLPCARLKQGRQPLQGARLPGTGHGDPWVPLTLPSRSTECHLSHERTPSHAAVKGSEAWLMGWVVTTAGGVPTASDSREVGVSNQFPEGRKEPGEL